MKEIKKLPKEILEEGITLEDVNNPSFQTKCSPAILNKGEEIVSLIRNSSGQFWVMDSEGKQIRDGNNLFVVSEKEARIGRARYLLLHGEEEKKQERERFYRRVEEQCEQWIKEIDREVETFYYDLQVAKCLLGCDFDNVENSLFTVESYVGLLKQNNQSRFEREIEVAKLQIEHRKEAYSEIKTYVEQNDYHSLAKFFGKIPKNKMGYPIFSANLNNDTEMQNFKKIFGSDAIEYFDGDMFKISAAIHLLKN